MPDDDHKLASRRLLSHVMHYPGRNKSIVDMECTVVLCIKPVPEKILVPCMRILLITIFMIFKCSLVWGILYPLLISISEYSLAKKTTIIMFIQYMSHTQYVLSGSIVGLMWDLETSWNFNNWFYSKDKWGWLCVIQYPVWWHLILRYCYTYDIYKISLTETIDFYFSLQIQTMSILKIFSATLFQE